MLIILFSSLSDMYTLYALFLLRSLVVFSAIEKIFPTCVVLEKKVERIIDRDFRRF